MGLQKNVTGQKLAVYAYDTAADAPKTGDAANITAQISKDFGAAAATNDVNPTELDAVDHPGVYVFDLTQAETNADAILLTPVSATGDIVLDPVQVFTVPPNFRALGIESDGMVHGDLKEWLGVAPLALSSQRVQVLVGAITNGVLVAASFAAGAFDAVWTVAARILTAATNITSTGGTTVPQTGDAFARLGAPAGASHAADTAAVKTDTAAIKLVTDKADDTLEDDGGTFRFTINALEQAPAGGGGGSTDWTSDERTAIRSILGVPLSGTTPLSPSVGIMDTIRDLVTALNNISASDVLAQANAALETAVPDSVPADGSRPSVKQAAYMSTQFLLERVVSGTTLTIMKPDGVTPLFTILLNHAVTPTSLSRAS